MPAFTPVENAKIQSLRFTVGGGGRCPILQCDLRRGILFTYVFFLFFFFRGGGVKAFFGPPRSLGKLFVDLQRSVLRIFPQDSRRTGLLLPEGSCHGCADTAAFRVWPTFVIRGSVESRHDSQTLSRPFPLHLPPARSSSQPLSFECSHCQRRALGSLLGSQTQGPNVLRLSRGSDATVKGGRLLR